MVARGWGRGLAVAVEEDERENGRDQTKRGLEGQKALESRGCFPKKAQAWSKTPEHVEQASSLDAMAATAARLLEARTSYFAPFRALVRLGAPALGP